MKQQVISDKKIVIVEDEKEILDLLNLYLGNEGFEVISFSSSEGVLELGREIWQGKLKRWKI